MKGDDMSEWSYDRYIRQLERDFEECPEHEGQPKGSDCEEGHCVHCWDVKDLTACPSCDMLQCADCWKKERCTDCGATNA